jgi:DNA-binding HxlR family transcriptional regulator
MALLDLLGRRASLRIVWELRDGRLTFRGLLQAAGTNPGVLNTRLKELREAMLVDHAETGYGLTAQGRDLLQTFLPLDAWAERWARAIDRKAR